MRVVVVALREEIGQDADDVVAELRLVVVDAGVEVVAAAGDLRVDEPAAVRVVQLTVGNVHLRDLLQLLRSRTTRMCAKCWSKPPAAANARVDGHA